MKAKMEWTRSETLALAQQSCTFCFGLGMRPGRNEGSSPCNCVFRAIFRACYERFRLCVAKEKHLSKLEDSTSKRNAWGLQDEEYTADFCLVSQRVLSREEHKLFRYHYLLGADWKLCCHTLNLDRGTFFHEIYRIEQKLGRAFRELQPHALFPVDEYFNGCGRYKRPAALMRLDRVEAEASDEAALSRLPTLLKFPIKRTC